MADCANECCYRSDGWPERLSKGFESLMLYELVSKESIRLLCNKIGTNNSIGEDQIYIGKNYTIADLKSDLAKLAE